MREKSADMETEREWVFHPAWGAQQVRTIINLGAKGKASFSHGQV